MLLHKPERAFANDFLVNVEVLLQKSGLELQFDGNGKRQRHALAGVKARLHFLSAPSKAFGEGTDARSAIYVQQALLPH